MKNLPSYADVSGTSNEAHSREALHYNISSMGTDTVPAEESCSMGALQPSSSAPSHSWSSARTNALNSSTMGCVPQSDATPSSSSSYPSWLSLSSMIADDRAMPSELTRVATQVGTLLGRGEASRACAEVPSPVKRAVLEESVNIFREFVAQLPLQAAAPTADTQDKEEEPPQPWLAVSNSPLFFRVANAAEPSSVGAVPVCHITRQSSATCSNSGPLPPPQLPPSTVPSHRICTTSLTDRAQLQSSPTAQFVSSIPACSLSRTLRAPTGPSKANDFKNKVVRSRSVEPMSFLTIRRREKELCNAGVACANTEGDDEDRSPIDFSIASSALPCASPLDPLHEDIWVSPKNVKHSDSTVSTLKPRESFQLYLDHTRKAVLSTDTSDEERTTAFDDLTTRSKELFDLLDGMQSSLFSSPDKRHCSALKALTHDRMLEPSPDLAPSVRPGASTAAVGAVVASANNAAEQLSLTTRAYATQLAPSGSYAAHHPLGGFERGRRNSSNSFSTTSLGYIDVINNYFILRLIGTGATGRAYLALDRKTNHYYALKTVAKRTRRSTARQFPLPNSSSPSECSVFVPVAPMSLLPESATKPPPQHAAGGDAAGPLTAPTVPTDDTSCSSINRITCQPSTNANSNDAKQQASCDTRVDQRCSTAEQGLQEADMEYFARLASPVSNMAAPYMESIITRNSSSVSAANGTLRDSTMLTGLMDGGLPSLAAVRMSNSFPRKFAELHRAGANSSRNSTSARPSAAPSSIRAATPNTQPKAKSAYGSKDVELSAVEREIRIMRRVHNHHHVVQLKEVIDDDDDDCAHLVMTYAANGPLTKVHGYDPALGGAACNVVRPFSRCARLLRQLAEALMYVHRQRIVHNDVKPDNILLTESDNILLTDFGESVLIPKHAPSSGAAQHQHQQQQSPRARGSNATVVVPHNRWKMSRTFGDSLLGGEGGEFSEPSASYRAHGGGSAMGYGGNLNGVSQLFMGDVSFCPDSSMFLAAGVDGDGRLNGNHIMVGSPAFAAPELIDNSTCSYHSDTWSFGVVMYAIVFGRLPFAGASISETFSKILHSPLTFPPLDMVPQNEELTEATYNQWVMLCKRMLVREPQKRLFLHSMLQHAFFRSAMPASMCSKNTNGNTLSSSCRSAAVSKQLQLDSANGCWRSSPARHPPQLERTEDSHSPISRTVRSKPAGDAGSPLRLMRNESLPPVTAIVVEAALETEDSRTTRTVSTAMPPSSFPSTPTSRLSQSNGSSSVGASALLPQADQQEKGNCPFGKEAATFANSEADPLVATCSSTMSQLPSLATSAATEVLRQNGSLTNEETVSSPSSDKKMLVHCHPSGQTVSERNDGPKEGLTFSLSKRFSHHYPVGSNTQTPVHAALMMDCAAVPPTTPAPDASHLTSSTAASQTMGQKEMRRLGLNAHDSTSCAASRADNGAANGGCSGDRERATSHEAAPSTSRTRRPAFSHAESGDCAACGSNVDSAACKPPKDGGSLTKSNKGFSDEDRSADYCSYWNDLEEDVISCSNSEEAKEEVEVEKRASPALLHPLIYHSSADAPRDEQAAQAPVRQFCVSMRSTTVAPIFSSQEEVAARQRRGRPPVARIRREKDTPDERQAPDHPLMQWYEDSATKTSVGSKDSLTCASDKKTTSSKGSTRCSLRSIKKCSRSLSTPEAQMEGVGLKQPPAPASRSWRGRHH
ncbi:Protein kinase-like protein [Leptomonas seymouri]|uniref:Protein kinase-like protein n=1 Tax=Leptomonas seymouri TaxID=5684 RepID=A0A0N1I6H1_LEPSE|nr:Protein kinase-like protein [Leptomonas seymouri]|eukprot:KPI88750.1 Protein kinase-like protein [Leptomonas seymouri]